MGHMEGSARGIHAQMVSASGILNLTSSPEDRVLITAQRNGLILMAQGILELLDLL